MYKKLLQTFFILTLALLLIPMQAQAAEIVDSGTVSNIQWTLDSEGQLTISGTGDMPYCDMESEVPWLIHADQIKTAIIEEGITSIGPFAFYKCLGLTDVEIPDGVRQIYMDAFNWCRNLKTVTLPDSVLSLGDRAFYNCDGMESIHLGEGLMLIGKNAFDMCRSLKSVTIPASVTAIESYAFQSCESLASVTFQGDPPVFSGGYVFSGVGNFPSDTATCYYPAGNEKWTEDVMQDYGGDLNWVALGEGEEEEDETVIQGICGTDMRWMLDLETGILTISGTGYMNDVSSMIYSPWYSYRDQIRSVVIEEGVISVGDFMLSGLDNLTEVTFPDSLRSIGKAAFELDTSLLEIDLTGIETIQASAFSGCAALTEVTLPEGIYVGAYVFRDCTGLKKVTICPNTMAGLGGGAELFAGCTSLTDVQLEEGVTFLPQYMFSGCTSLQTVTIPSTVEVLAGNAFEYCTALTDVNFVSSIGTVGGYAFQGCTALRSITFPGKVGELEEGVFRLCENLDSIIFTGDAPVIDGSAFATLKVTCYYPGENPTWNEDTLNYYGSTLIEWVPAAHVHSYVPKTVAPTCTEQGYTTYSCGCGYSYVGDQTPALGHTEITVPGKEAACTESGLTDGRKCSVCGVETVKQEPIEALGHDYMDGICIYCGEMEETIQPDGPETGNVIRISGQDRYATSFAIADELKNVLGVDKFQNIVLANSDNFADALAGSYLAAVREAPIIIGKQKYAGIVCDYLNANLAEGGTIYILGGEEAMPNSILDGMTVDYTPVRLAGDDRYATNLAILEAAPIGDSDLLIATGRDFADSLSASASGLPILLVNSKEGKTLSAEQKDFLETVKGDIYILGGESAVNADFETEIENITGKETIRLSGAGRYETSVKIAEEFLPNASSAVLAYASTFPDGLCGGPLAYAAGAPLILTKDGKTEAPAYTKEKNITSGYVLGGEGLISDATAEKIFGWGENTEPEIPDGSSFRIHFIDVGQADAALVECDGHYMLIDGGNVEDSNVIYSVLKKAEVSKLDIVVGSHAHEDHIGGLPGAFSYTNADLTLSPVRSYDSDAFGDFSRYAALKGGGITVPEVGDTYTLGSAVVTILGVNGGSDANDTSIILRIDYGETSFLFTGDAEREAEQTVLASGADLKATVLKVGHHGSETSTTYPFLRGVLPQYAVISVGAGNGYDHPHEATLSRLRDAEVTLFRTDLQGDIFCTSDGKTVTFSVTRNPDADVFGSVGSNSTQTKPTEPTEPAPPETQPPQTEPPETEPPQTEPETGTSMVWIPKTGSKYHTYAGCSNMKNPTQVTKTEAIAWGYTPCKRCH